MSKILLVFHGLPPTPGAYTTGSGIRAQAIAEGLRARGHDVSLAVRDVDLERHGRPPAEAAAASRFPLHLFGDGPGLMQTVARVRPDALVVQQWEALAELDDDLDIPVAVDLVSPRPVEDQFRRGARGLGLLRYARWLSRGDYFFCAGERQRRFWLAFLMFAGVDCRANPVDVVPTGAPPDAPGPDPEEGEPVFVCGGVYWPWLSFAGPLSAVLAGLDDAKTGKVLLLGGDYPLRDDAADPEPAGPGADLLALLKKGHPRLSSTEFMPYDELKALYRRARAGLDLFMPNAEREIAVSYRTMDYLQCGAAVVSGNHAQMASEIEASGAGWLVDPRDDRAIRDLAAHIAAHPDEAARRRRAAHALATGRYAWDRVIDPLDTFVSSPRRRPRAPVFEDELMEGVLRRERDHERVAYVLLKQVSQLEKNVEDWRKDALMKEGRLAEKDAEIVQKASALADQAAYIDRIRGDLVNRLQELAAHEARFRELEAQLQDQRGAADRRYAEYEQRLLERDTRTAEIDAAHQQRLAEVGKAADLRFSEYERRYLELEFRANAAAKELGELRVHYEKNTGERARLTQKVEELEARLREQRDHYENMLATQKGYYEAWLKEKQAALDDIRRSPVHRLQNLLKKPERS